MRLEQIQIHMVPLTRPGTRYPLPDRAFSNTSEWLEYEAEICIQPYSFAMFPNAQRPVAPLPANSVLESVVV